MNEDLKQQLITEKANNEAMKERANEKRQVEEKMTTKEIEFLKKVNQQLKVMFLFNKPKKKIYILDLEPTAPMLP